MGKTVSETQGPELPKVHLAEWSDLTKEKLSQDEVFIGLLDHGLFAEKLPSCFTSVGLANFVSETKSGMLDVSDEMSLRSAIDKCAHDYVRFEALRDTNIPRHMGIPHPESYAVQALAISKHWKEIAIHCNLPEPSISRIYVRHVGNGRIFEMNYRGTERFRLEEEELDWMAGAQYVVEADIATCFPSIYSHAIPWALNGKDQAKKTGSLIKLAGNLLDKCTQNTRDRQTNGLLIGPNASNIISEIILTSIDSDLQRKGHRKAKRHIDDYRFFANSHEEAEKFIQDLGLSLRVFELTLNEKKTCIKALPRPSDENWVLVLNRFQFPEEGEVRFSVIRSFLDQALECAQVAGKSTPLNYAIKVIARDRNQDNPKELFTARKLNSRARRMYVREAMNLTLAYPYLLPLLDKYVLANYWVDGLESKIAELSASLIRLGLRKLYPDTISHAFYLALKYDILLLLTDEELGEIIELGDCFANVMLLEYAKKNKLQKIITAVTRCAKALLSAESREIDKQWLLVYQVWSVSQLDGNGQGFLARLKERGFEFFTPPKVRTETLPTEDIAATNPSMVWNEYI